MPETINTISNICHIFPEKKVIVDGGVKPSTVALLPSGVHGIVSGSFVVGHPDGYAEALAELRAVNA